MKVCCISGCKITHFLWHGQIIRCLFLCKRFRAKGFTGNREICRTFAAPDGLWALRPVAAVAFQIVIVMTKHFLLITLALLGFGIGASAQSDSSAVAVPELMDSAVVVPTAPALRFGHIRYDSLLQAMPEYGAMEVRMKQLRERYNEEIAYSELAFKRQFAEFLEGQKRFPENILLKRQRDLQQAMERSIAFRHEADSILRAARIEMERPVRALLNQAIRLVGIERKYTCIVNTDGNELPFLNPEASEDATAFITEKLILLRSGKR